MHSAIVLPLDESCAMYWQLSLRHFSIAASLSRRAASSATRQLGPQRTQALPDAMLALAKGDITHVRFGLEELLEEFQLNLDVKSQSYRRLGMAVLAARVKALKDIARRNNV